MASWLRRKIGIDSLSSTNVIEVDFSSSYQTMVGFGGSMAYYTNWVSEHPNRERIYETIFGELMPTLLRFRNTYSMKENEPAVSADMKIDAMALKTATRYLGYTPSVLLTSWSPPARLKESGQTKGGCKNNVIIRSPDGSSYAYTELARWWLDSVKAYESLGMKVRYVSPQNEPDYDTAGHECCTFASEETRHSPGYDKLVAEIYNIFRQELRNPPGLVGPEHTKIDGYLPSGNLLAKLEAVGNHLYGSGDFHNPDSLTPSIKTAGQWANKNRVKDLFMTEYGNLANHAEHDPMKLATIIHNTLVYGNVSAYFHWDLFWGAGTGEGTLVLVDNPFDSHSKWRNREGFTVTQSFWFYAHFSRFIRPGYTRRRAYSPAGDMLVSAFSNRRHDQFCVILINTSTQTFQDLSLQGLPGSGQVVDIYQSTTKSRMSHLGQLRSPLISSIPPLSITTISTPLH